MYLHRPRLSQQKDLAEQGFFLSFLSGSFPNSVIINIEVKTSLRIRVQVKLTTTHIPSSSPSVQILCLRGRTENKIQPSNATFVFSWNNFTVSQSTQCCCWDRCHSLSQKTGKMAKPTEALRFCSRAPRQVPGSRKWTCTHFSAVTASDLLANSPQHGEHLR